MGGVKDEASPQSGSLIGSRRGRRVPIVLGRPNDGGAAASGSPRFERSRALAARLAALVPGGSHTYAKGDDQYPVAAPGLIARGSGCRVWDADGNEFIEFGMGLRSVTLGHAYPPIVDAVRRSLDLGTNFTRPSMLELECAEAFLGIIRGAEMVKFTKDGSTANTAALRLARAHTGRDLVVVCRDHPFYSYDDWYMTTTTMDGGIPADTRTRTKTFRYNDLPSLEGVFNAHPDRIAAVFLEPARTSEPAPGFLEGVRRLCDERGTVLVFDETITGFRWHLGGAQEHYGVIPDLSVFGKALANGFSLSALCGKRELMRRGSRDRAQDNVFLLSTTHGAESTTLVAGLKTIEIYRTEPVVATLHRQGDRLAAGVLAAAKRRGVDGFVDVVGRACNLIYVTRDANGHPSQGFRSLFLQEMISRGVLAPSFVVSYSHTDADIDRTIAAVDGALEVYARALEDGFEKHLLGRPTRPVYDGN
jgi:glutamate-1-semialdehyde 2,1-aminomutase